MFNSLVKPSMLGVLHFPLLVLLILGLCAPVLAQAPAQSTLDAKGSLSRGTGMSTATAVSDLASKRVLILHSYGYALPTYKIIDQSLTESFVAAGLNLNNLYFEFMDLARYPGPEYRTRLIDFFCNKYKGQKFDLVLTVDLEALSSLLKEAKDFYPEGPIISLSSAENIEHSDAKRPVIRIPALVDVTLTAKAILNLQPDTQKLLVIAGSSAHDRLIESFVRAQLEAWKSGLHVEYMDPLPLDEILKKVANLPAKTAILYTIFYADSTGKTYLPRDVGRMISQSANAPVFGFYETLLGDNGIVGGFMPSFRFDAERAVRSAVEILRGNLPSKPWTILPANIIPMYDWQQIERWGLNESALPANAIILNKPVSAWEKYRLYIIGAVAFFVLETTLIIFLVFQRRRKKVAEEELNQFFNISPDLICIANPDGYFVRLNAAWERILGYTHEELMAKRFYEFIHPDDLGRTREVVFTLTSQQKVNFFENRYRCKDGTYQWLEWSSAPVGKLIYAAARDITERKRAEAEVAHARAELLLVERSLRLSELTASLAHELNQPLAAILSNAQAALRFLQSDKPDLNEFQEIMRDIVSDDQRAGNVIRSLRSMMKREEGEKRPTILNDVLNDVIRIFRSEAIFRNVRIETELDGSLPPVFGNKGQLQQVVLNLIMNAAEVMSRNPPEQRKVILRTQRKDHSIWAIIRDFGPGIDKENLERVFQPFFTTKGTGLGMGLAVCSSIIKDHRGRIWAENNPDGGATFFIELPIDESGK